MSFEDFDIFHRHLFLLVKDVPVTYTSITSVQVHKEVRGKFLAGTIIIIIMGKG